MRWETNRGIGAKFIFQRIKMTPSTIPIAETTKNLVDEAAQHAGVSASEFVDQAIQDALFLSKYRTLRERLAAQAKAEGIETDEDVFERVS